MVDAADRLGPPEGGDGDQVELQLQLRVLLELFARADRRRELVIEDEGATVRCTVDAVDRAVQAPAVDIERRTLGLLGIGESGLQQPGLEARVVAPRLVREEAREPALDAAQ